MTWQTNIEIWNRSGWDLRILSQTDVLAEVPASESWSHVTHEAMDLELEFSDAQGQRMRGRVTVSPDTGVYLDRGDLPGDQQPITLAARVPGMLYTQSRNGGTQVLPSHQFLEGGAVEITFLSD